VTWTSVIVGIVLSSTAERRRRRMVRMSLVLGFAHHTGRRLAEVGFLLLLFAGVWLAAAQIPQLKFAAARTIVAALALAISGLLLVVATHWGHFG
jgi:hypothetical protein